MAYVHPLPGAAAGRTDEGVDFRPAKGLKIRAIGDAVVAFIGSYKGFGTYVAYRLTSGRLKGTVIYVAEGIDLRVKVGQKLRAGQTVALATGAHGGIEMGFAQSGGSYLPVANPSYSEGQVTTAGKRFAQLLTVLGSNPADVPSSYAAAATASDQTAGAPVDTSLPATETPQPGGPPAPQESLPSAYPPGAVPADGQVLQDPAETWRLIAAQPLASQESQLFASRLTGA